MEETQEYVSERFDQQKDSYDSLLLRLDPSPELEAIYHYLMREKWDASRDVWYRPKGIKPRLDPEGVDEIMSELKARMGISKVLSMTDKNDINRIKREVGEVIYEFFMFGYEKYNILESDFSSIYYTILHNVELFLKRTLKGRENELVTKAFGRRESVSYRDTAPEGQIQSPQHSPFSFWGRK